MAAALKRIWLKAYLFNHATQGASINMADIMIDNGVSHCLLATKHGGKSWIFGYYLLLSLRLIKAGS
jgi:hypothetical protein